MLALRFSEGRAGEQTIVRLLRRCSAMNPMWVLLVVCVVGACGGGNQGGVTDATPETNPPTDAGDVAADTVPFYDTHDTSPLPDIPDTTDTTPLPDTIDTDIPCTPVCDGKECGDDGCGGSCGACINDCNIDWDTGCLGEPIPDLSLCDLESGICAVICCPSCCNKECGDDGCGGSCGQCEWKKAVCVQGNCICEPHCDGKDCGDDGCGGECGTCSNEEQCVNSLCGPPWGGTWIEVPGGLYVMGCTAGDDSCDDDELPPHQVMVSSFEMLQTEVTEEQYENVTGEAVSCGVSWPGGPNTPVTCVTWFEAGAFCEAVGGRLPTEAEWEYAARGGTTTQYYCGDDPACLDEIAWYVGNSGGLKQDVMWKDPNDYGLHDMLGNVWEWTEDWYHDSYDGAPQVGFPAWESLLGSQRVARGGDIAAGQGALKVYRRSLGDPSDESVWNLGFRCARAQGD